MNYHGIVDQVGNAYVRTCLLGTVKLKCDVLHNGK